MFDQARVPFYNGPFRPIFGLPSLNSVMDCLHHNRILPPVASRFYTLPRVDARRLTSNWPPSPSEEGSERNWREKSFCSRSKFILNWFKYWWKQWIRNLECDKFFFLLKNWSAIKVEIGGVIMHRLKDELVKWF